MGRKPKTEAKTEEKKRKTPEELLLELDGTVQEFLEGCDPPVRLEAYVTARLGLAGIRILGVNAEGETAIAADWQANDVHDALARSLWELLVASAPEDGKIGCKQAQSEQIRTFALSLALALGDNGDEGNSTIDDIQDLLGEGGGEDGGEEEEEEEEEDTAEEPPPPRRSRATREEG